MTNTIFTALLVALVLVRFLTDDYLKKSKVTFALLIALSAMCVFHGFSNFSNLRILASFELIALALAIIGFNVYLGIKEYKKTTISVEDNKEKIVTREPAKKEKKETEEFEDLEYVEE